MLFIWCLKTNDSNDISYSPIGLKGFDYIMKSYILNLVPIYMAIFISHKQFIINLLVLIINIDSFFNNSFFF